jgi:anti-sigma B factor antagonist
VTRVSVQADEADDAVVVSVSGEVDIATCDAITQAVAEPRAAGRPVVLDLSRVVFLDSTGVRTLIGAARAAGNDPALFAIRNTLSPPVERGLRLMGVLPLLPLVDA